MPREWRLAIAAIASFLTLVSCGDQPVAPRDRLFRVSTGPANDSPAGALRLLEWSWNQRATDSYCVLFPDDFRFLFNALDPNGVPYRNDPWTREDEMAFAEHLFEGGHPSEPPATSISLELDRNFTVAPDPRPGKDARWHKFVRSGFHLRVIQPANLIEITGHVAFSLVRGDSASFPGCGGPADSSHWYIERWEDETTSGQATSLGGLKALYR